MSSPALTHMPRALRISVLSAGLLTLCATLAVFVCCISAMPAFAEDETGGQAGEELSFAEFENPADYGETADDAAETDEADYPDEAGAIDEAAAPESSTNVEPVDTSAEIEGVSPDEAEQNLVDPTQRADNSFIYDTSIGAIAGQSSLYDNRIVQVEGEVIGDKVAAGNGYNWVELASIDENDTANISVLLSEDQAGQIDRYGKYGVMGTILQVRGTYHQACDEHDGLSDIHATNSSVVSAGEDHPDSFDLQAFIPGLVTIGIGVILLLVFRFARERMR